jgi:hypothetical protein
MIELLDTKIVFDHILLGAITFHDKFKSCLAISAAENYMLPTTKIITGEAMRLFLITHPVVLNKTDNSKEKYECVGGMRTLLLAKSSLPLDHKIPALVLKRPRKEDIAALVAADILLSPLLLSIRNPSTIGRFFNQLYKENSITRLLNKTALTKVDLAKHMGFAKNTVFPCLERTTSASKIHAATPSDKQDLGQ